MKHVKIEKEVTRQANEVAMAHNEKVDAYTNEIPEAICRFVHTPAREAVEPVDEMTLTFDEIRRMCRKWNLRFGKLSQFRYQIPQRSMVEMADYCEKHEVEELYCVAPPKMFGRPILERREVDPIVLAPIKFGTYEIVTQWGDDLKWWRRVQGSLFNPGPWNILAFIASLLFCSVATLATMAYGASMDGGEGAFVFVFGGVSVMLLTAIPGALLHNAEIKWDIHRDA